MCVQLFSYNGDQQNQIVKPQKLPGTVTSSKQEGDWGIKIFAHILPNLREIEVEVDLREILVVEELIGGISSCKNIKEKSMWKPLSLR